MPTACERLFTNNFVLLKLSVSLFSLNHLQMFLHDCDYCKDKLFVLLSDKIDFQKQNKCPASHFNFLRKLTSTAAEGVDKVGQELKRGRKNHQKQLMNFLMSSYCTIAECACPILSLIFLLVIIQDDASHTCKGDKLKFQNSMSDSIHSPTCICSPPSIFV